ncbi:MAG: hypothetical protein MZV64_36345 [Ignavibacteriales bacterium]|nr:hypothetical protein [Ignavibacteriales bacterium]
MSFHSGCCGASAFTRSSAKYDLDRHRLLAPERAVVVEGGDAFGGTGTKSGEPGFVTFSTKSTMDCLAWPSFQEGSGSAACEMAAVKAKTLTSAVARRF